MISTQVAGEQVPAPAPPESPGKSTSSGARVTQISEHNPRQPGLRPSLKPVLVVAGVTQQQNHAWGMPRSWGTIL